VKGRVFLKTGTNEKRFRDSKMASIAKKREGGGGGCKEGPNGRGKKSDKNDTDKSQTTFSWKTQGNFGRALGAGDFLYGSLFKADGGSQKRLSSC